MLSKRESLGKLACGSSKILFDGLFDIYVLLLYNSFQLFFKDILTQIQHFSTCFIIIRLCLSHIRMSLAFRLISTPAAASSQMTTFADCLTKSHPHF